LGEIPQNSVGFMQLIDIRSNLFFDSLPPIFVSVCRQSVIRALPVTVSSIERLMALKQKLSIY
jgi:hypothetical protein